VRASNPFPVTTVLSRPDVEVPAWRCDECGMARIDAADDFTEVVDSASQLRSEGDTGGG
jgi:hypothetical protein